MDLGDINQMRYSSIFDRDTLVIVLKWFSYASY